MKKGFTLTELIIVLGILATLISFAAFNMIRPQQQASLTDTATTLVSDIRLQQSKAMLGETEGTTTVNSYGVHFTSDSYTLFRGATFSPSDPANFAVNLDSGLNFSIINLPDSNIIFAPGNGEITGFQAGSNTFTLSTTDTNSSVPFFVNKYGIINF